MPTTYNAIRTRVMPAKQRFPFALIVRIAALASCAPNDLPPGSLIERDRVLGARVEVDGDPQRAAPAPGERATVTWIVEGPGNATPQSFELGACAAGPADCTVLASATGESTAPALAFDVGDHSTIVLAGTIGDSQVAATVRVAVDGPELANRNPSLAGASITLAGATWDESAVPAISVAEDAVAIAIEVPDENREHYIERLPDGTTREQRETIQISQFTTVGSLEHQFSVIEADATDTRVSVDWLAPDDETAIPESGVLARFVFVVRDGRGGLDVVRRTARIVP